MSDQNIIANNLDVIRNKIINAAKRSGRNPEEITLIAVSKLNPAESVETAIAHKQLEFGENWVKELLEKESAVAEYLKDNTIAKPNDIKRHFIGHLQTNKVKQLNGKTVMIHSVD